MIQINYDSKSYLVPSSPMELTIDQYVDLYSVVAEAQDQTGSTKTTLTTDQIINMLSIITTIPQDIINSMQEVTLSHLLSECHEVLTLSLPEPVYKQGPLKEEFEFEAGGLKYKFQPNYAFSPLNRVRLLEDIMGEYKLDIMNHLHYVLAILARTEGEVFDQTCLNDKAAIMKEKKFEELYHPLFFFVKSRTELLTANEGLFKKKRKPTDDQEKKKAKLPSTKDKVIQRWGWYHVMNRLLDKGHLGKTIKEIDEMHMVQVFEHLTYLHDMNELERAEINRQKLLQKK